MDDLDFLAAFPDVISWLGFEPKANPFLVPPEILNSDLVMSKQSYVLFGQRTENLKVAKKVESKAKFTKSPYLTPIINDPEIFSHLSVKNQLEKQFNAAGKATSEVVDRHSEIESDPFESILSFEQVSAIRRCWSLLLQKGSGYPASAASLGSISEGKEDYLGPETDLIQQSLTDSSRAASSAAKIGVGRRLEDSQSIPISETDEPSAIKSQFATAKEEFHKSMSLTSGVLYSAIDKSNQSLRIFEFSVDKASQQERHATRTWAPHEINYQRQVQRRGGELHVLTAAGNTGRMKVT